MFAQGRARPAVGNGFGQVRFRNVPLAIEVGKGAGDLEHSVHTLFFDPSLTGCNPNALRFCRGPQHSILGSQFDVPSRREFEVKGIIGGQCVLPAQSQNMPHVRHGQVIGFDRKLG